MKRLPPKVQYSTKARRIIIQRKIDHGEASAFARALKRICQKDESAPIGVFVSGEGGDIFACLQIYQLIHRSKTPIFTVARKKVSSGAFYIIQGGIKRFALKNTRLKFHNTVKSYESVTMNAKDLRIYCEMLTRMDAMQILIFSERGRPIKKIDQLFQAEATLTAQEAKKLKLIDAILPQESASSTHRRAITMLEQ